MGRTFTCSECGKEFQKTETWRSYKTCSPECHEKRAASIQASKKAPPAEKQCVICGTTFMQSHKRQVTCSPECAKLRHKQCFNNYYEKNREKHNRVCNEYNKAHKEETRRNLRKFHEKHPEAQRAYTQKYLQRIADENNLSSTNEASAFIKKRVAERRGMTTREYEHLLQCNVAERKGMTLKEYNTYKAQARITNIANAFNISVEEARKIINKARAGVKVYHLLNISEEHYKSIMSTYRRSLKNAQ